MHDGPYTIQMACPVYARFDVSDLYHPDGAAKRHVPAHHHDGLVTGSLQKRNQVPTIEAGSAGHQHLVITRLHVSLPAPHPSFAPLL